MDNAAKQSSAIVAERFDRYKRTKTPIYEGNTIEEVAEKAGLIKMFSKNLSMITTKQ